VAADGATGDSQFLPYVLFTPRIVLVLNVVNVHIHVELTDIVKPEDPGHAHLPGAM
jgi:hypothetical protein